MTRILIAEDDRKMASIIALNLEHRGYDVEVVNSGAEAIRALEAHLPSLLVLDIMMPGVDGWEVLATLRGGKSAMSQIPVIVVSAKREEVSRLLGFQLGADDYLTKPFSMAELAARVRAVLQRARPPEEVVTVPIAVGNKTRFVTANEIVYVSTVHNYTHLHIANGERLLSRHTLSQLEQILPSTMFLRVHRGYLLNISFVRALESPAKSKYSASLAEDVHIPVSRDMVRTLREKMASPRTRSHNS